ncbi:MAG: vitamin K epoxide reductase family protein [Rhodococcus sp. (in: high G+C Gram-positive bacteria)]
MPVGTEVPSRVTAWAITVGGVLGLLASLVLVVERFELLADPNYVPSCSLNPVLSCGSVMTSSQAALFGFPNPILGIPAFTVVLVAGALGVGSVRLPRWFWAGLALGLSVGVVFVHWLIFQSLYRIGALCPYCMVVWAVTVPLWVIVVSQFLTGRGEFLDRWKWSLVALWFTVLILLCLERFWSYWSTLV